MIVENHLFAGLTFFRQARMDRGVRTGIMLGGTTVLGRFEEGEGELDPALIWSVDLRCEGDMLPTDPEGARAWLLSHEPTIRAGFTKFVATLEAGADPDFYPLQWSDFDHVPSGIRMRIVCHTQRRVDALGLADVVADVRDHWVERIESLEPHLAAY